MRTTATSSAKSPTLQHIAYNQGELAVSRFGNLYIRNNNGDLLQTGVLFTPVLCSKVSRVGVSRVSIG